MEQAGRRCHDRRAGGLDRQPSQAGHCSRAGWLMAGPACMQPEHRHQRRSISGACRQASSAAHGCLHSRLRRCRRRQRRRRHMPAATQTQRSAHGSAPVEWPVRCYEVTACQQFGRARRAGGRGPRTAAAGRARLPPPGSSWCVPPPPSPLPSPLSLVTCALQGLYEGRASSGDSALRRVGGRILPCQRHPRLRGPVVLLLLCPCISNALPVLQAPPSAPTVPPSPTFPPTPMPHLPAPQGAALPGALPQGAQQGVQQGEHAQSVRRLHPQVAPRLPPTRPPAQRLTWLAATASATAASHACLLLCLVCRLGHCGEGLARRRVPCSVPPHAGLSAGGKRQGGGRRRRRHPCDQPSGRGLDSVLLPPAVHEGPPAAGAGAAAAGRRRQQPGAPGGAAPRRSPRLLPVDLRHAPASPMHHRHVAAACLPRRRRPCCCLAAANEHHA